MEFGLYTCRVKIIDSDYNSAAHWSRDMLFVYIATAHKVSLNAIINNSNITSHDTLNHIIRSHDVSTSDSFVTNWTI